MNKAMAKRIVGYAIILLIAGGIAIIPALNRPQVYGDRLEFSLPNLQGDIIDHGHEDLQGKVLMVNLWGTWCPPCRVELPHLIRLKKIYGARGFEIVAIEFPAMAHKTDEERRESLSKFAEEVGINYTVLLGGHSGDVAADLPTLVNASAFPTNIFIGRDGKVQSIHQGFYEGDVATYEAVIERMLEE